MISYEDDTDQKEKGQDLTRQQAKYLDLVYDVSISTAEEEGALAFVSKCFVQASLPHSDPGTAGWKRKNGMFTLAVKSGFDVDDNGHPVFKGVPYGSIPRLLIAWINSEAVRQANDSRIENPRVIFLGRSLSEFLEKIGIEGSTGGKNGSITRFKNQAERLFRSEISIVIDKEEGRSERDVKVSDSRFFFWDHKNPQQTSLWNSLIELSEPFYKLMLDNPLPLDWRVLKGLTRSPMAIDLYMWLTHRMWRLKKIQKISWKALEEQLGSDFKNTRDFKIKVKKQLKKLKGLWPELDYSADVSTYLTLYPSRVPIQNKQNPQILEVKRRNKLVKETLNHSQEFQRRLPGFEEDGVS